MTALRHERAVGDTLSEFSVQLRNGDNPYDLTGFTVKYTIIRESGAVKLTETDTGITVSDAAQGLVELDFPANAVDEAGIFYLFFKVYSGLSEPDTFPPDDTGVVLDLFDVAQDRQVAAPSIDIIAAANTPERVRTVEGTVQERSIRELIEADRYNQTKNTPEAVPWGIRLARTKPPSIVGPP